MLIHSIIKILYTREGYLPNYPYHLISDKEMFDAFLNDTEDCYFSVNYPCLYDDLIDAYEDLITGIQYHISAYLIAKESVQALRKYKGKVTFVSQLPSYDANEGDVYWVDDEQSGYVYFSKTDSWEQIHPSERLPDWVYSYMLGTCVSFDSDIRDRHDLLTMLNLDNIEDEITEQACKSILDISTSWVRKLPPDKREHRPPTLFGEPHVMKCLRLINTTVVSS